MNCKYLTAVVVLLSILYISGCAPVKGNENNSGKTYQPLAPEYIRTSGQNLVIGSNNTVINLHGVCFGNQVWSTPSIPPTTHHAEADFARVTNMHMNAIRFYMNYQLFEDDSNPYHYKQTGWDWLAANIQWAETYGVFLILNMHVPQGGFQSLGTGLALWNNPENQNRLTALWKAIADYCKNYTNVAAYDLVNEPVTSSSKSQWVNLAARIAGDIRTVDPNHMIIVERLNAIAGNWANDADMNFFQISDPNIAYEFHFYSPIEYTHQLTSWTGYSNQDGGPYPDLTRVAYPSDLEWADATLNNPVLSNGSSGWTYYTGILYQVTDPLIVCGKPAFVSANNSGAAYFDDFDIEEYNSSAVFLRTNFNTNIENLNDSWFWSQNGSGQYGITGAQNHAGSYSSFISNTTSDANISANVFRFVVTNGHYYKISGYMKGSAATGNSRIRIDFEKSPSGSKPSYRDITYLSNEIYRYLAWGKAHNVPLYCGEFGVFIENVTNSTKGGTNWIHDVVKILKDAGVHNTYHSYHETGSFGIYTNGGLPNNGTGIPGMIKVLQDAY